MTKYLLDRDVNVCFRTDYQTYTYTIQELQIVLQPIFFLLVFKARNKQYVLNVVNTFELQYFPLKNPWETITWFDYERKMSTERGQKVQATKMPALNPRDSEWASDSGLLDF